MWLTWKYGGNNHISVEKLRQDFRTIMCSFSSPSHFGWGVSYGKAKTGGQTILLWYFSLSFTIIIDLQLGLSHTHRHAHNISNKNSHFSQQKWGGLDANTLWYQTTTDGHGSRIHKVVQDLEHMQSLQIHLEDRFWNYVYIYILYKYMYIYIYVNKYPIFILDYISIYVICVSSPFVFSIFHQWNLVAPSPKPCLEETPPPVLVALVTGCLQKLRASLQTRAGHLELRGYEDVILACQC